MLHWWHNWLYECTHNNLALVVRLFCLFSFWAFLLRCKSLFRHFHSITIHALGYFHLRQLHSALHTRPCRKKVDGRRVCAGEPENVSFQFIIKWLLTIVTFHYVVVYFEFVCFLVFFLVFGCLVQLFLEHVVLFRERSEKRKIEINIPDPHKNDLARGTEKFLWKLSSIAKNFRPENTIPSTNLALSANAVFFTYVAVFTICEWM